MKINARIKKIERALQDQIIIPNSERFIVVWPNDTEEEKELKLKNLHEELKRKYGDDASRQAIITMNVIYDEPALSGADELNQGV
ncbi:MAG TPA: hypothetical protein PKJ25_10680 [Smithellaceae bacterium]|nr:hypothetical protein [Smithellaceae bacterium]